MSKSQTNRCADDAVIHTLIELLNWVGDVQRDDDYLRQILLDMEASPDWQFPGQSRVMAPTAEEQRRNHHIALLLDAGLLAASGAGVRMSNAGHDFLATTRTNETWEKVKAGAAKLGGVSVGMLAKIAEAYVMQKAVELGILPRV